MSKSMQAIRPDAQTATRNLRMETLWACTGMQSMPPYRQGAPLMADKITTLEMEVALSTYFNYRVNLIVPNVSWGMSIHECDLLIVSQAGYLTEVEIKVTKADLKADAKKWHGHESRIIKRLFFALPDYLENCIDMVPERAGIILVRPKDNVRGVYPYRPRCKEIRPAQRNKAAGKLGDTDRYKVARLGALRIWNLKRKLVPAQTRRGQ